MKKLSILWSSFSLFLLLSQGFAQEDVDQKTVKAIKKQLKLMENSAKTNRMQVVADIYLDNAFLLSQGNPNITGRVKINEYWLAIKEVIDWKLDSKIFTTDLHKIYAHPQYQQLKNKPPDWKSLNLDLKDVVYELGISNLKVRWKGQENTSVVTYILLWQKQSNGKYKILIDTYSGE